MMSEGRGTCSTKHALLRRLALEQDIEIALVVGIYQMNARNTPGVGDVLEKYGLESLPEAHCYLRSGPNRIDVTRVTGHRPSEEIKDFIYEEKISPEQTGEYKATLHRRFLRQWVDGITIGAAYTLDDVLRIREECISALAGYGKTDGVIQR